MYGRLKMIRKDNIKWKDGKREGEWMSEWEKNKMKLPTKWNYLNLFFCSCWLLSAVDYKFFHTVSVSSFRSVLLLIFLILLDYEKLEQHMENAANM